MNQDIAAKAAALPSDSNDWLDRAVLYELLSMGLLLPTNQLAEVLSNGDYASALGASIKARGFESFDETTLETYRNSDVEEVFHRIRREYTRLFAMPKNVLVSPYAGVWHAEKVGVQPVLFVNKESMGVERFMKSCGLEAREGKNEPFDHIGTEFEFLNYLCLRRSGFMAASGSDDAPENAYEVFYEQHIAPWVGDFAKALAEHAEEPLYRVLADVLCALPEKAL